MRRAVLVVAAVAAALAVTPAPAFAEPSPMPVPIPAPAPVPLAGPAPVSGPAPLAGQVPLAGPVLPPLVNPLTTPDRDPFYTPPSSLDHYRPGELIRSRAATALIDPRTLAVPSRAWQIMYRSNDAQGEADAVTGTVIVPLAPWTGPGPRPLITYAIGTHGLADRCAPSYQLATGTDIELPFVLLALARGWAVSATDYEGLGTPGDHTYFVQLSEGRAVLDAARAAMNLHEANVSRDAKVGIWGYSQGGGAAGMAAELAADYAPELNTVGVAEGGVIADVRAVLQSVYDNPVTGGAMPGALVGYIRAYPEVNLEQFYTAVGRGARDRTRQQCLELIAANAATPPSVSFTANPLDHPALVQKMARNSLGHRIPDMPILVYSSPTDEAVRYPQVADLVRRYCAQGARLRFDSPLGEHFATAIAHAPIAVQWLADRFAGRPAPSTC